MQIVAHFVNLWLMLMEMTPAFRREILLNQPSKSDVGSSSCGTCYPSPDQYVDLSTTSNLPSLRDWWCNFSQEYAWLGFSYSVSHCPSQAEMTETFSWMRNAKRARYVRLYGACDGTDFNNQMIEAAAAANLGVYSLIWFGFDPSDEWKGRKNALIKAIQDNPKAPYVIRAVTVGSEPLYDHVMDVNGLVQVIEDVKKLVKPYDISVTLSEMTYGFQINGDAPAIFNAIDLVSLHVLPIFDTNATTSDKSWRFVNFCMSYGKLHGRGKKVLLTQTGWPSNKDEANVPQAVTDLEQEARYFALLDGHCPDMKAQSVGWFSHIYAEDSLSGWGIVHANGTEKIPFNPRIEC